MKRKGTKRGKVITLTTKHARTKQDLGNGFTRLEFLNLPIPARGFRTFRFSGMERNVIPISGGWFITNDTTQDAWVTANYPQTSRTWIITMLNPTKVNRTTQFFVIVKNPS
ncbi:hypothetical protein [Robertmurraya sp.]|uniref:hypothetical protein n=1 Tax=Robertmurraya sp. TaxID=2837525 RepID=UPI00370482F8